MTQKDFLNREDIKSLIKTIELKIGSESNLIYPPKSMRFLALEKTPIDAVKVVILGQDPYHGKGQAHGLAFSCLKHPLPPSLKNIFKAIENQYGRVDGNNGDLTRWAKQGVLLWNVYLSVVEKTPLSHAFKEYEALTSKLLDAVSQDHDHIVFLLWGTFAHAFEKYITGDHLIIKTVHPSPLSAYRGFFHTPMFVQTNEYLTMHGKEGIDWT